MRRRSAWPAIALLFGGAVLFGLSSWPDDDGTAPPNTGANVAAAPPLPATTALVDAASTTNARTELASDASAGTGPLVVVTLADGVPLPQPATVAWVAQPRATAWRDADPARADIDDFDLPVHIGRSAPTDRDGRLLLPAIAGPTIVAAFANGSFAAARIDPGRRRCRLVLADDETLRLAVVEHDGSPATAVPLAIEVRAAGVTTPLWRGITAADGRAVVRHFQCRRGAAVTGETFVATATVPFDGDAATRTFEARPVPADEVLLTLPANAPLAVVLAHRSGVPIQAELRLDLVDGTGPAARRLTQHKPAGDAPLRFARVGIDRVLQPEIEVDGAPAPLRLATFRTRTPVDGDAPVVLTLGDDGIVVSGRWCDQLGRALGDRRIDFAMHGAATVQQGRIATLADGRGELIAPSPARGERRELVLRATSDDGTCVVRTLALDGIGAGDRRDFGDVRLLESVTVARGSVVDDVGAVVPETTVRVERRLDTAAGPMWQADAMLTAIADPDGRFAILGAAPAVPFRLRADAPDHATSTSTSMPIGADATITLPRLGTLHGRIALPTWLPESRIEIALLRRPDARPVRRATLRQQRGEFWIRGLVPGHYTALVTIAGVTAPVAVLDGVRLDAGTSTDPRLQPLDLSQRAPFVVSLVGVRRLCGPDRDVHVVARRDGTEVATAPLDPFDRAMLPMPTAGSCTLELRIADNEREPRIVVQLGTADAVLDAAHATAIAIDVAALTETFLRQR